MQQLEIATIWLQITERCNQRCTYCYNSSRPAKTGQRLRQVDLDLLRRMLERLTCQAEIGSVTLTGGEPLTHPQLLPIINEVNHFDLSTVIISNGGLIQPQLVQEIAAQKVSAVQITLTGGDAASHDSLCGAGSFYHALTAIELLSGEGIPVLGSYLCTAASSAHAEAVLDLFAARGVQQVALNRFSPSGQAAASLHDLLPTRSQVLTALDQAEAAAVRHQLEISVTMPIPPCMVDEQLYPHIGFAECSAGTENGALSVDPEGNVSLCAMQPAAAGSLLHEPLEQLLRGEAARQYRSQIPDFCHGCPHATRCRGGCGAAAAWVFGSARELDPFLAQHVMEGYEQRIASRDGSG